MGKMKQLEIALEEQNERVVIGAYEVKNPTVADVPELFELMTGGEVPEMSIVIKNMLKTCVFSIGEPEPIGDEISNVPLADVKEMVALLTVRVGLNAKK